MGSTADCKNLLECAYYWEKNVPDRMYFTQPMGGGDDNIKTWTWQEAVVEARRMAAYLKSLDLPERSHIALCSKNCAQLDNGGFGHLDGGTCQHSDLPDSDGRHRPIHARALRVETSFYGQARSGLG